MVYFLDEVDDVNLSARLLPVSIPSFVFTTNSAPWQRGYPSPLRDLKLKSMIREAAVEAGDCRQRGLILHLMSSTEHSKKKTTEHQKLRP